MKTKLLFLLMALLPLSTFTSDADENELKQEIPLIRTETQEPIMSIAATGPFILVCRRLI